MDLRRLWADNLKAAREAAGLSQFDLAVRALIDQGTISKMENGTRGISDDAKVKLARALGVPAGELFPFPDGVRS